jgi:hypothetical protein
VEMYGHLCTQYNNIFSHLLDHDILRFG